MIDMIDEEIEHLWVLFGRTIRILGLEFTFSKSVYLNFGTSSEVGFNADSLVSEEEQTGRVVGFLHTHPHCDASPSNRDRKTMFGWVGCFGKPLICAIRGIDGTNFWVYTDDHSEPVLAKHFGFRNRFFSIRKT